MTDTKPELAGARIGIAMCGSFCTFARVFEQMIKLRAMGAELFPNEICP